MQLAIKDRGRRLAWLVGCAAAAACGAADAPLPEPYAGVGGAVEGLVGTLVLRNLHTDLLMVRNNGSFIFPRQLAQGEAFEVDVALQPELQTCQVFPPTGTVGDGSSQKVSITCSSRTFPLGGSLGQILAPLVLRNNAKDDLTLTTPGPFVFAQELPAGARYRVTAESPGQACRVDGASGVMDAAEDLSVMVSCQPLPYPLGGTVSGLPPGEQLRLAAAGQELTLAANGSFFMPTPAPFATPIDAHVVASPAGVVCRAASATAQVVVGQNLGLAVSCQVAPVVPRTHFSVGGSLAGARGPVTLSEPTSGSLVVSADGIFAFPPNLGGSAPYAVGVAVAPAGQACVVANGSGSISGADVSAVTVTCSDLPYQLGGSLSGLAAGKSLTLRNGGDRLVLSANGAFVFAAAVPYRAGFAVTVDTEPVGQICAVSGATGQISAANQLSLTVACRPFLRLASGQAAGLALGQPSLAAAPPLLLGPACLFAPAGIWAKEGGALYVSDAVLGRVRGYLSRPAAGGAAGDFLLDRSYPGATDFSPLTQWQPAGIGGDLTTLAMVDRANSRVLVWKPAPSAPAAPSLALGQATVNGSGSGCSAAQLNGPAGLSMGGGVLAVADGGNHRVLIWRSISASGQPADLVLGQPNLTTCGQPASPSATSLNRPQGVWTDGTLLLVADSDFARVLWWRDLATATHGSPADGVLGQADFVTGVPHPDPARRLSVPTGLASSNGQIWVADPANSRVLGFDQLPATPPVPVDPAADVVLGATSFSIFMGCNFGGGASDQISDIGMCAPTSLAVEGERLYVGDVADHRVTVYNSL